MSQQEQSDIASSPSQGAREILWSSSYSGDSGNQLDTRNNLQASIAEAISNCINTVNSSDQDNSQVQHQAIDFANDNNPRILNSPLIATNNPFALNLSPRAQLSQYMDNISLVAKNNDSQNVATVVGNNVQKTVWERIHEREQRTLDELRAVNARLHEIDLLQRYPLSSEIMFRGENDIKEHPEDPNPALFEKLDAASEADRRAFAANLLNKRQIDNILLGYELRYLTPIEKLPFDEEAIINKAVELLERFQWIGGGIYIDDTTWGIHRRSDKSPLGDFSLTNTVENTDAENICLDTYLTDLCLLLDRHFEGCDARYKGCNIPASDRILLIIFINHKDVIAERKNRRRLNNANNVDYDSDESDNSDNSDKSEEEDLPDEESSADDSDKSSSDSNSSQSEDDTRDL